MTDVFRLGGRSYQLLSWWSSSVEGRRPAGFRSILRRAATDPTARRVLRKAHAGLGLCASPVSDHELAGLVADHCQAGRLRIIELPESYGSDARHQFQTLPPPPPVRHWPAPVEPAPEPPPPPPLHWIELELVDDAGAPVPRERFMLIAPDGRQRTGRLDDNGFARVERLEATDYEISYPDLGMGTWKASA